MLNKINYRTLLGFAGSGILLWLTFHNSGLTFRDIVLTHQQFFYFIIAIVLFILSVWLYSIRAKLFWLNEKKKFNDIDTYNSLIIGNFYNCLLPGNLGEGVRAWHFNRKNQVPFLRSLSAIISEKWIDAQLFFLLSLIIFLLKPIINHFILVAIALTSAIALLLSITYYLMVNYRSFEKKIGLITLLLKKTGRILFRIYWHTKNHLSNVKKNGLLGYYLILCFSILFLNISQFYFLLNAAGVQFPVGGWYTAYLAALSMMIIVIVPSAPSNIGVMHYGIYSALILSARQYGIEPDEANLQSFARFAIYVHLSYVIPEVLMGVFFVIKERKIIFEKRIKDNPF